MNTDEQMRVLLTGAAELPDLAPAPVERLIARGQRQRRMQRAIVATASALVVAGAAVGLPALGRTAGGDKRGPAAGPAAGTGPTAAQLSRFRWSALPASPLGPRSQPITAWTGHELLELGGLAHGSTSYRSAAYDPATRRWHRIAATGGNVGFSDAVSVWTGRQLFVTNGQHESCPATGRPAQLAGCLPHAGLYNPATNRWTLTLLPSQMDGLTLMSAVWTGRRVVLAGIDANHGRLGVAAYDPAANRWQMITPRLPARHPARVGALVAAPGRVVLWSLWDREKRTKDGSSVYYGVDVLTLSGNGDWHDATGKWPQNQTVTSPVFAGSAILVSPGQIWCGTICRGPYFAFPGYFADPATLARTLVPSGPLGQADPAFVWTGRSILAINLDASISYPGGKGERIRPGDMAAWSPGSHWFRVPAIPGHPPVSATPVWTGTAILTLTDDGALHWLHR